MENKDVLLEMVKKMIQCINFYSRLNASMPKEDIDVMEVTIRTMKNLLVSYYDDLINLPLTDEEKNTLILVGKEWETIKDNINKLYDEITPKETK